MAAVLFPLLCIAFLAIPLRVIFNLSWRQHLSGEVTLHWLFGLVQLSLPIKQPVQNPPAATAHTAAAPHRRNATPSKLNIARLWRQQALRERMLRFLRELWRALKKRDLNLAIRVGLDDPAETGYLWAMLGPLTGLLYTLQDAHVEIETDFLEPGLMLDGSGNIQIIPLQLVYLIMGLLLSPALWRGLRQARAF